MLGGIGSIPGAMIGGLLLGLLEAYATGYLPQGSTFHDLYVFILLITIILIRPSGILGKPAVPEGHERRPDSPDEATSPPSRGRRDDRGPRIGVDEWVASAEGRRAQVGPLQRAWRRTPPLGRLAVFVIPAIAFPFFANRETSTATASSR